MINLLIIFCSLVFENSSEASEFDFSRRLADIQTNSLLTFQMNNDTLLKEHRREWVVGNEKDGLRCSLTIDSHFDENAAKAAGYSKYTVTQVQRQSLNHYLHKNDDHVSMVLEIADPNLPLLLFDCYRSTDGKDAPNQALTFKMISDLFGYNPFSQVILSKNASKHISDIVPVFSSAKTLLPLRFRGKMAGNGRSEYSPYIQAGSVYSYPEESIPDRESAWCTVSISGMIPWGQDYDFTLPAGSSFSFQSAGSTEVGGDRWHLVGLQLHNGPDYFQIDCSKPKGLFQSAKEIFDIFNGVIEVSY